MADLTSTRDTFRGLIIPWAELSIDTGQTTVTQAGPVPGHAVPQQSTALALVTSGEMAASQTYTVRVQRPGYPTGTDQGLGIVWRHDDAEDWRGCDPPGTLTAWEAALVVPGGSIITPEFPAALTLRDGSVLCFYGAYSSALSKDLVRVIKRDPDTGAWGSAVTVYTAAGAYPSTIYAHPAPLLLPSGRILVFYFVYDQSTTFGASNDQIVIYMSYSDDDGATWTIGSRTCAPTPTYYNAAGSGTSYYDKTMGMVAYYHPTGVGLWYCLRLADTNLGLEYPREVLFQGASATLGTEFTLVAQADYSDGDYSTYLGCAPAVCQVDGAILLGWAQYNLSVGSLPKGGYPICVRLSSVWEPYVGREILTVSNTTFAAWYVAAAVSGGEAEAYDLTMTQDDAGNALAVIRNYDAEGAIRVNFSNDTGATWTPQGRGSVSSFRLDDAGNAYPWRLSATWQRSRLIVMHQSNAVAATVGDTIGAMYYGGWSTVTRPMVADFSQYLSAYRINLSLGWLPIELPDNTGYWTDSGAGTPTLSGDKLNISTTANALIYTRTASASSVAEGLTVEVEVTPVTSVATSEEAVLTVIVADGVAEYRVTARIGTAAVTFRDDHAAAGVGATIATATLDTTGGVVILLDVTGDSMIAYVRARSAQPDREWTAAASSSALTDAASYTAPVANCAIQWGHRTSTAESNWHRVSWDEGEWLGTHLTTTTYPLDLQARHIAATPCHVDGGFSVQAFNGPGYMGDEFDIATRYEWGRERIDPRLFPSPRHAWRTLGTDRTVQTTQQTYTWRVDETITTASRPPGSTLAISVHGANWRTGSLRRRATGGAYTTVATLDAAKGLTGLGFARTGASVQGDTANVSPPYFHQGELRGAYIDLGSNTVRRISRNTAGFFGGSSGKRCVLYLEDIADTEPTSGAAAAIWPANWAYAIEIDTTGYRGLQLIIDAQYTSTGYVQSGTILPGHFEPFAFENSWGRVVETTARVERTELRDGTERSRQAGPAARTVELAWVDGIDLTGVSGTAPHADTIATTSTGGALPAGVVQETPIMLEDMIEELVQARTLAAYVARFGKSDEHTVNRRENGPILVRFADSVRREVIQGTPNDATAGEVVRIATTALREIT